MANQQSSVIWVVVRRDRVERQFDVANPHHTITLREAVPTAEEAEPEAARLNALNAEKGSAYFAAPVKWFPEGRDVEVGY